MKDQQQEPKKREPLTNWLMVIVSVLLFFGTMLQWLATRDSIHDAEEAFRTGTRAWVVAKEAHIRPTRTDAPSHGVITEGEGIKESTAPIVSVTLVNVGHSPARNLATTFQFEVLDYHISDDQILPPVSADQTRSVQVLGPEGSTYVGRAQKYSPDVLAQIKNGRKLLVAYGVATYLDIFNQVHQTKVCYFYSWEIEKMASCPHFNSTD